MRKEPTRNDVDPIVASRVLLREVERIGDQVRPRREKYGHTRQRDAVRTRDARLQPQRSVGDAGIVTATVSNGV